MLSVHHLQDKAAEGPSEKHCNCPSPGASAPQLPVPGARERKGGECPGGDQPLYLVCPGVCYSITDGPHNGQGIVGQFHCPLWTAREDPFGPRDELRE